MFTLPLTTMTDPFDVKPPKVAIASAPAVMPRFDADVVKMVGPVAPPVELRIVSVAPIRSGFAAIVYVARVDAGAQGVRVLNAFLTAPSAANESVARAASRLVSARLPGPRDGGGERVPER